MILAVAGCLSLTACPQPEEGPDTSMLMMLALMNPGAPCVTCSCTVGTGASRSCRDYPTDWGQAQARTECSSGTLSTTTACSTTLALGSCANIRPSASGIGYPTSRLSGYYYVGGTNPNTSTTSNAQSTCTSSGGTFTAATTAPSVRFINNSGSTESYTLNTAANCLSGTTVIQNNVTNGSTTSYVSLPAAGTYYISYNGAACSAAFTFSNGSTWTITSTSVYSFAVP